MTLAAEAFAKTNLRLVVLGRRPDGYHDVDTVFQTIDLTDRLEVSPERSEIVLECDDASIPRGSANLVVRAAEALRSRLGISAGARIRLLKNIPAGGGLGGGSSDAAVALLLLSRLWKRDVGRRVLAEVGAGIGSDVPFFFVGGTARGRGRGEILEPLDDAPPVPLVVLVPPFSISTADVYARWREEDTLSAPGPVFGPNSLASAVLAMNPEMDRHRRAISHRYPDVQVSGSGSCLVAWEGDRGVAEADALAAELPGARVLRTRTVSRKEYERRSSLQEVAP
ncbi:MAG TPA: 4-(cytidine 5'-diphospho)-2-C-methyl-D-erythritol kinase [Thermoanaerobaculia bacterium]|nr:4-(cytidine 5'-diphospho)-2-C-methyl-D-erythritol kinase [Thermoanaerobaculia bacterium]